MRQYLQLIRLPNVFTAPSNILAGYFAAVAITQVNGVHLASLMASSAMLYVAGIVLNDYADIEVDKRERPSRPLAAGTVPKGHAKLIAIAALVSANALALTVSATSVAVSALLTAAIVAYNFRLKRGPAGPFSMGSTRFLNVILGASPMFVATVASGTVLVAATLLFVYVVAIMILSKREVGDEKPNVTAAMGLVSAVIVSLAIAGFMMKFQWGFLLNLGILATLMGITFRRLSVSKSVPQAIKYMVLSIVVLDSVFVSGTAGLVYGLATLLFIVPAGILAKKLYVT